MHARKLIETALLLKLFEAIEPELFRYPAITPRIFRSEVEKTVRTLSPV